VDFLILISRSIHIISICTWLGGFFYQRIVIPSSVSKGGEHINSIIRVFNRSFARVSHLALGLLLISGVVLMLSDHRFSLFSFQNRWSTLLIFKQIIFILTAFLLFGYSRMLRYMGTPSSNGGFDERVLIYKQRIDQYQITSIILGTTAVIFGVAMHIYG
jgi:putative copper export protein